MRDTYIFGPVPSRRLGLSLGVDIVPFKVCTLDCVYCQIGSTTEKTVERRDYVDVEAVLAELKMRLAQGIEADFITISGSGEPTLNVKLGQIIKGIKKITEIPVAVLTNGTLFTDKSVRADCAKADVVLPSLDAGDEQTFRKINRPHADISIESLISGLCAFRDEFTGQIWLEVFLVEGLNTDAEQIAKIKGAVEQIGADKIQLNTAVRPTADGGVKRLNTRRLRAIADKFGQGCEVIADLVPSGRGKHIESKAEYVLSMLKRRPCTVNDVCSGLGISRVEALECLADFQRQGLVNSEQKGGIIFFKAN